MVRDWMHWARFLLLICVIVFVICSIVLTHQNLHGDAPKIGAGNSYNEEKQDSKGSNLLSLIGSSRMESQKSKRLSAKKKDDSLSSASVKSSTWKGSCVESFTAKCSVYPYVKFWSQKFRFDDCFQSPLRQPLSKVPLEKQKFLVFEPDRGGWNNIRMAAETAIVIAHVTGRVLVLPPATQWYLLDKNSKHEDNVSHFGKYFDLTKIMESLDVISMGEFINRIARKGLLNALPPTNNTHWVRDHEPFWKYLESACHVQQWEPGVYFWAFNITKSANGTTIFGEVPPSQRMKLLASHNRKPIVYDQQLHDKRAIYFPGDYRNTHRILTHFYSYIFWASREEERKYKRFVRDRLHYHDDIFCAAGRAVKLLHQESSALGSKPIQVPQHYSQKTGGGNSSWIGDATYYAYHIRRGDFQYKDTQLDPSVIWENTKHLLDPNVTTLLYIATDEKNKALFAPFTKQFKVRFLSDISDLAHLGSSHLNQNHIGMVEQVICANAHTFIGTPYSTFTGYITRMRGYYRDGRYKRTFYTMTDKMYQLQQRTELIGPFWAREFAVAHNNIDDSIYNATLR